MLIVSESPLYIAPTMHPAGIPFECPDDRTAHQLIADGVARLAGPPKVLYETKVIQPREVGVAIPFRDMPMSDERSAAVAAAIDPVLPKSDIPEPGAADRGRRRGRFPLTRK
jgi:hypothetical protein